MNVSGKTPFKNPVHLENVKSKKKKRKKLKARFIVFIKKVTISFFFKRREINVDRAIRKQLISIGFEVFSQPFISVVSDYSSVCSNDTF